jgi:mono/diheme cytochrome c family protein
VLSWLIRLILLASGTIAGWMIAQDAPNFGVVQAMIALLLIALIVFVLAFWRGALVSHHQSGWWKSRMSINAMGSRRLRGLALLAAFIAPALTTLAPIRAQDVGQAIGGNIRSGRALARAWCAQCHRIEPGRYGIFAADFGEVANLPSTTALSLRVFLQSSHKEMPNVTLKPAEVDDIVAYILSLKRGQGR